MKIFISWSGTRSKELAKYLQIWLKQVIQAADPWISTEIDKGRRWNKEISDQLSNTNFGIICLTPENLDSKWIHFEAGALSKTLDSNLTCLLLGTNSANVEFPLAQFQHTSNSKEDLLKMLKSINQKIEEIGAKKLDDQTLNSTFEVFYPQLQTKIKEILKIEYNRERDLNVRTDSEILEEILELSRSTKLQLSSSLIRNLKNRNPNIENFKDKISDTIENYDMGLITENERNSQIFEFFLRSKIIE